jgi:hypothetical protein
VVCQRAQSQIGFEAVTNLKRENSAKAGYVSWWDNARVLRGQSWVVDTVQLLQAYRYKIINKLPYISKDELGDQNKGDFLVKGLAVVQVLWLIVEVLAWAAKKLTISQLEIVVLAFSVCTFLTYVMIWEKPQDVKTPGVAHATRYPKQEELTELANVGPVT